MDEQLLELEAELKALRPRRPSPQLGPRIELDLAASSELPTLGAPRIAEGKNVVRWAWFGAALAAAATVAVIATVTVLSSGNQPATAVGASVAAAPSSNQVAAVEPAAATNKFRPVRASNVLYDLKDEGVVYLDDNTPARQMRYRYLDTYTWRNPKSNASLKWSMPRDEVRVVPASLRLN